MSIQYLNFPYYYNQKRKVFKNMKNPKQFCYPSIKRINRENIEMDIRLSTKRLKHMNKFQVDETISNLSNRDSHISITMSTKSYFTNVCVGEMLMTILETEAGIVRVIATVLCRIGPRPVLIRVS